MNPLQGLLHLLSDPNIAFILFTIGFYGLIFELQNPNFVTGILGALAIILAFIGFGSLPLNLAGPDADRAGRRAVRPRGDRHQPRPARDRRDHLLRAGRVCPVHDAGRPDRADRRGGAAADRDQHRDHGHPHGPDHARGDPDPPHGATRQARSATPCRWAPRASSRRRSSRWAPSISPARRGARGPRTPARSRGTRRSASSASTASPRSSSRPGTRRRPRHRPATAVGRPTLCMRGVVRRR